MLTVARLRRIAAIALIAAGSLVATGAHAQAVNDTAERAAPLSGTVSGALPGGQGGHFAFYKFTYPGNWHKVTINLNASPNDYNILQYAGFKVYGPTGREYLSAQALRDANPSATADLITIEPGEYMVQVYNYAPEPAAVVNFSLNAQGLPEQPAVRPAAAAPASAPAPAAAAPAPAAAPASAMTDNSTSAGARPFTGSADGQLDSGPGGHFQFFKFQYPGEQRKVTINLTATPNDAEILKYVGFKVYGPTGREYLTAESFKDANPSATAELATIEPGEYMIQVYNYAPNPDVVVTFQLKSNDLPPQPAAAAAPVGGTLAPAPAPAAAPARAPAAAPAPAAAAPSAEPTTPELARELTPQSNTASGSLPGAPGGRFHYYKFTYPGDTRKVTISLTATPNDFNVLQFVGIKLYGPSVGREYASAGAQKDAVAIAELSNQEPGIYTIQVYSYVPNPDTGVSYTVSITGL
jgi:hypothetical protein